MGASIFSEIAWKTALTDSSTTAQEQVGILRYEFDSTNALRGFRYMQAAADTTVASGVALAYSDTLRQTASSDISDASPNQPAGVGIGAIAASSYGWVQCYGYHATVNTNGDDDIADGDTIILGADGVVNSVTAGTASTYKPLGVAVAADVDGDDTVATFLDCA